MQRTLFECNSVQEPKRFFADEDADTGKLSRWQIEDLVEARRIEVLIGSHRYEDVEEAKYDEAIRILRQVENCFKTFLLLMQGEL